MTSEKKRLDYDKIERSGGRGLDGYCAFYMFGNPVERVYESELRHDPHPRAQKLFKELIAWKAEFLKGQY